MKLIHCADLHLDSRLQAHLDRETAKRRRDELLRNFARLSDYAAENGVEAVLIAGDLFDRDVVSSLAKNTVLAVIRAHPRIRFYYLRGNHDTGNCLGSGHPENLYLFGMHWTTYTEGKSISISGIEWTDAGGTAAQTSLRPDPALFNIVLLHGQLSGKTAVGNVTPVSDLSGQKETGVAAFPVSLRALRGRGIDYLALGHLHAFQNGRLDERGVYCYPGCLEGRGFDECGPHGFALLEIDEERRSMTHRFVPFAQRTLYALDVDVAGCRTTAQMNDLVTDAVREAGCTRRDMVSVTLRGELDVDCEKDTAYLQAELSSRFFFARVKDDTSLRIDVEDYLLDETLRGEFVRLVMEDPSVPEEEKAAVIRCGFRALDGEEP